MMSAKETTTLDEEKGAEEEEDQEEGAAGSAEAASVGSMCSRFVVSYTALLQVDSLLMAPVT